MVKEQKIAQDELTGSWEKYFEEIRSGASVEDFEAGISEYKWSIKNGHLAAGAGLAEKLDFTLWSFKVAQN